MGEKKADPMDVEAVLDGLNRALVLQRRSVLQFTTAAGSMFGLEVQGLTDRLWTFAVAELEDARQLVEKISALGGEPSPAVADSSWTGDPQATLEHLIATEDEVLAALHDIIPDTGQEPRSEALEHLLEHLIMRKQNQVDWLRRAARRP